MKNLSIERMDRIEGGSMPGCFSAAFGVAAFALALAATPVTGGTSLALAAGLGGALFGGLSTGLGIADCAEL